MIESIAWSVVLRCSQSFLQAAPFILCGLFVAGILRRFLGPENTRRMFGGGGLRGLLVGWLMGMLLPVCSLGCIPVLREMRRAGLPGGTILAFAISAPLFNPLSLLYGLTLSEPMTILAFALGSLVVVTLVGGIWDWWFPGTAQAEPPPPQVPYGLRRLGALLTTMGRDATDAGLGYIALGIAGVGLLAAVLPPGSLQRSMNHDNPLAPLLMSLVAIPAYASPMLAMSQLGMMFQHGNSVGAAFVLLALGAGMNLGTLAWMLREYGPRRAAGWFVLLLGCVLLLSYGIDKPLFPRGADIADHTHAFDGYCRAFHPGSLNLAGTVRERLKNETQFFEIKSAQMLLGVFLVGLLVRVLRRWVDIDGWLERHPAQGNLVGRFDLIVSPAAVGVVILLGIIAFSIVGCFSYYPPPKEVFEEMYIAQGEALGSAMALETENSLRWIAVYDDWTRKLEVGVYLRRGSLSEYHRMKAKLVRDRLELLEHEVQDREVEEVRKLVPQISKATARMKRAYLEEL